MLSNYVKLVIRYSHNIAFREKKKLCEEENTKTKLSKLQNRILASFP